MSTQEPRRFSCNGSSMLIQRLPNLRVVLLALAAVLLGVFITVMVTTPAFAQDGQALVDQSGIESTLLALSPIVTLISSLVLRPNASKAVKKAFPAVVGVIVSVLYFLAESWPDTTAGIIANLVVVITLAQKFYDPLDGFSEILAGRRLNDATGPGFIGAPVLTEGD